MKRYGLILSTIVTLVFFLIAPSFARELTELTDSEFAKLLIDEAPERHSFPTSVLLIVEDDNDFSTVVAQKLYSISKLKVFDSIPFYVSVLGNSKHVSNFFKIDYGPRILVLLGKEKRSLDFLVEHNDEKEEMLTFLEYLAPGFGFPNGSWLGNGFVNEKDILLFLNWATSADVINDFGWMEYITLTVYRFLFAIILLLRNIQGASEVSAFILFQVCGLLVAVIGIPAFLMGLLSVWIDSKISEVVQQSSAKKRKKTSDKINKQKCD
eukprot:g1303.t1